MRKKQKNIFEEFDGLQMKQKDCSIVIREGKRIFKVNLEEVEKFMIEKGVIRKK